MKNSKSQSGFAVIELAIVIVVLAALAFVGFRMMNKSSDTKASTTVSTSTAQTALPATIQTKGDVSQSIKSLDSTPIDNKLDPSQLDSSISSLL